MVDEITHWANQVATEQDADVLLYNGEISWDWTPNENVIDMCKCCAQNRPNVVIILVSHGGDPDAAYRISRCLQHNYQKVIVYIPGFCKSAGTLIAIGGSEIVMSDHGQLGPLDVQIEKPDELFKSGSGLDEI